MKSKINIFCMVDVIELLSIGAPSSSDADKGMICMMDNSPFGSLNQGTLNLITLCQPGQTIHWHIVAVDLQTPVEIRSITFLKPNPDDNAPINQTNPSSTKLYLNVWEGIVPYCIDYGVEYKYRLELQMYEGKNSLLHIDTPALRCV
ncbi:hypothetical conserved protein [Candidatus Nitrosoglobus terrae]|uniref:Hypothetical conserved protein n=1 Tax=Candidatus Nitrosoglobus terrae TaxID=1630141 RepID=A0A1Q2SKJ5_9GAMM|nr:hypothetical protein [Candidatus Nitrosoglobus terrae]BAW79671.1 hypothetical conserved protein [Candidatus Nitrosoglobus terrae]